MRTVKTHLDITKYPDAQSAITYFIGWAYNRFPVVDIYSDHGLDLVAHYRESAGGKCAYVIGAVWRPDAQSYTFHS